MASFLIPSTYTTDITNRKLFELHEPSRPPHEGNDRVAQVRKEVLLLYHIRT